MSPTAITSVMTPMTGREFLDSLDDGREVWIYGERVGKITEHPAFRNAARMLARLFDALHDPHWLRRATPTSRTSSRRRWPAA